MPAETVIRNLARAVCVRCLLKMDRFRKSVETAQSKWLEFVNRNWHNQPEGDYFRLFDTILLVGAVRPCKLTSKWQTIGWKLYRFMALFQYIIFALNFIEHLSDGSILREKVWHSSLIVSGSICFVLQAILNRFYEDIQTAQGFINGKPCDSGDTFYDAAVRKKFFQRTQLLMSVLLVLGWLDQAIVQHPDSGSGALFVTPRIIHSLGSTAADVTHFLFMAAIFPLWLCKRFAATTVMCSLMFAFEMEMKIFIRGFNNILHRVEEDIEANLPTSSTAAEDQPELKELRRVQRDKLFWKYLNQHATDNVKKHIELQENLQSLQSVTKWLFGAIYYYSLALVSPFIYSTLLEGISILAVMEISSIGCFFLECYWWCNHIESIHDSNYNLEGGIMDLMTDIPYTEEHHDDYVGMQKTLMIMKINVRNSAHFSCGGVFDITVEANRNLLDVSYSVLTFLIDMGKV